MDFERLFNAYLRERGVSTEVDQLPEYLYDFLTSGPYYDLAPTPALQQRLDELAYKLYQEPMAQLKTKLHHYKVPLIWRDQATNKKELAYLLARAMLGGVMMGNGLRRSLHSLLTEYYTPSQARGILNSLGISSSYASPIIQLGNLLRKQPSLFQHYPTLLRLLSESEDIDTLPIHNFF